MPVDCVKVPPTEISKDDACEILQEINNQANIHGRIIGLVLSINMNYMTEGIIFYSDGFTYPVMDIVIGYDIEEEPQYRFNLLLTKEIVMQIPSLGKHVEGDYLCHRGGPDEIDEYHNKDKTCYFVFRSPETEGVDYSNCIGNWMLDEYLKTIYENEKCAVMPEIGV